MAKRARRPRSGGTESELEFILADDIRKARLPRPNLQLRVTDERKFRFDFAWPDRMLAVEVVGVGGQFGKSKYKTPAGWNRFAEKINLACLLGWRVMMFTGDQVRNRKAIGWLREEFKCNA